MLSVGQADGLLQLAPRDLTVEVLDERRDLACNLACRTGQVTMQVGGRHQCRRVDREDRRCHHRKITRAACGAFEGRGERVESPVAPGTGEL